MKRYAIQSTYGTFYARNGFVSVIEKAEHFLTLHEADKTLKKAILITVCDIVDFDFCPVKQGKLLVFHK